MNRACGAALLLFGCGPNLAGGSTAEDAGGSEATASATGIFGTTQTAETSVATSVTTSPMTGTTGGEASGSTGQAVDSSGVDVGGSDETTGSVSPCRSDHVIDGDAWAHDMAALEQLEGIRCITGDLTITSALGFVPDLAPLWALERVEGRITLGLDDAIGSSAGLDALTYAAGLDIQGLLAGDLDGLTGLTQVGEAGLSVWGLPLQDLDGLGSLLAVAGDVRVTDVASLSGLGALESVAGDVWLVANPALVDVGGLMSLTSVEGRLIVALNESLIDVGALASVVAPAELHVFSNEQLPTCDALALAAAVQPMFHTFIVGNADDGCAEPAPCAPMQAVPEGPCDAVVGVAWTGQQCSGLDGCSCEGFDCVAADLWLWKTGACQAAFAGC